MKATISAHARELGRISVCPPLNIHSSRWYQCDAADDTAAASSSAAASSAAAVASAPGDGAPGAGQSALYYL